MRLVVKYGGSMMSPSLQDAVIDELAVLLAAGHQVVVVHGGGPEIDGALEARGIPSRRVDGLRVTGAAALEVTEAVLCGTLNKRLVRACLSRNIQAVGISGQDGAMLRAQRVPPSRNGDEFGYVGAVNATRPDVLLALLAAGFVPVVAPLALSSGAEHALNVNADTSAAAIAAALRSDALVLLTDVPRVLRDTGDAASGIDRLNAAQAREFCASPACRSSMRPKMEAAIHAVASGVRASYICAAGPGAITGALRGNATVVTAA